MIVWKIVDAEPYYIDNLNQATWVENLIGCRYQVLEFKLVLLVT
jgi:hypothetical protein